MADELIQNYQQQIQRQKSSIIDELRSSEKKLVKNINQNPKLWNDQCLKVKLKQEKPDSKNVGLSAAITVNRSNVINQSTCETDGTLAGELVRHAEEKERTEGEKEAEELLMFMDLHAQEQREKRRLEARRQRQMNALRRSLGLQHPPSAQPRRNDCQTQ